ARREELALDNVAIIRIEQLYPWPAEQISAIVEPYRSAHRVVWAQEESRNRGGWRFVQNRLAKIASVENIEYVGREPSPSPATGSFREHKVELDQLLSAALDPAREDHSTGTVRNTEESR
ncbi:MAG TPA: hypothetical protein VJ932_00365, partial [Alkalispirochaeta sp.]|nr:hypothetical protein [Alkalispirochaeta sp.]